MSGATAAAVEILIDHCRGVERAAVLRSGRLHDLFLEPVPEPGSVPPLRVGSVVRGRVERITAELSAAFIDLGHGRLGLLAAADLPAELRQRGGFGAAVRAGQEILVQIRTEARDDKGPALTPDVSLPGRFAVLTPLRPEVVISKRLRNKGFAGLPEGAIPEGYGCIVRSAAAGVPVERVVAELAALAEVWRAGPPIAGPGAAERAVIEYGGGPVEAIALDVPAVAKARFRDRCERLAPDLVSRLRDDSGRPGLFDARDVEGALAGLVDKRVPLSGGGSLVIEPTEALTVIDVNGGGRGDPLAINSEAAREIARQLRLRNLGGIVVIDFITLTRAAERERLLAVLAEALAEDPCPAEVHGLTRLGLAEVTRARRGRPAAELLTQG